MKSCGENGLHLSKPDTDFNQYLNDTEEKSDKLDWTGEELI